jgi:hypothetical protein
LACLIHLTHFNILTAIIDMNDTLDIATFRILEAQVRSTGIQPFDVSAQWPPEITINRQTPIQLVGFPECLREIDYFGGSVNYGAYQALALVEDYNDREIVTIYDPERSLGSPRLLPLGFNMSGCSGGPAIVHHTRNGIRRWHFLSSADRSAKARAMPRATIRFVSVGLTASTPLVTSVVATRDGYRHEIAGKVPSGFHDC